MRFRKRAVPKTGFYGTGGIFGTGNGLLVYRTHLQRCAKQPPAPPNAFSKAQKTASCHIERIFKGAQNSRLHGLWTAYCRRDASSVRDTAPFGGEQTKKVVTKNRDHFFDMDWLTLKCMNLKPSQS